MTTKIIYDKKAGRGMPFKTIKNQFKSIGEMKIEMKKRGLKPIKLIK